MEKTKSTSRSKSLQPSSYSQPKLRINQKGGSRLLLLTVWLELLARLFNHHQSSIEARLSSFPKTRIALIKSSAWFQKSVTSTPRATMVKIVYHDYPHCIHHTIVIHHLQLNGTLHIILSLMSRWQWYLPMVLAELLARSLHPRLMMRGFELYFARYILDERMSSCSSIGVQNNAIWHSLSTWITTFCLLYFKVMKNISR